MRLLTLHPPSRAASARLGAGTAESCPKLEPGLQRLPSLGSIAKSLSCLRSEQPWSRRGCGRRVPGIVYGKRLSASLLPYNLPRLGLIFGFPRMAALPGSSPATVHPGGRFSFPRAEAAPQILAQQRGNPSAKGNYALDAHAGKLQRLGPAPAIPAPAEEGQGKKTGSTRCADEDGRGWLVSGTFALRPASKECSQDPLGEQSFRESRRGHADLAGISRPSDL